MSDCPPAAVIAGRAHPGLAGDVARELGVDLTPGTVEVFPDGELHVAVPPGLRGADAYVVQPTGPPTHRHLLELFLLADACHRAGVARTTAVVPYLGYARQDRRSAPGEPVGLRVVADLVGASHIDRLLVVDPHTAGLEAVFGIPVETLTAVGVLSAALAGDLDEDAVVVAPDLGAVKLAERYAAALHRPVAVIRKTRSSSSSVQVTGVVGDVAGRTAVIVDDMISTGGTIDAAARALLDAGCRPPVLVAATHGLFVGPAAARLKDLPLLRLLVSDSLPVADASGLVPEVCSLAPLLAGAVARLHRDEPLEGFALFA